MGRRSRQQLQPACYHLTHRCHGREFLLKFRRDRQNYLLRLHEMTSRYSVDVMTYMITSNHVHLLVWAERAKHVSAAMHFLQGSVAGDYNRRKGREGSFWKGRYHPTLIESGVHLARCLFYIDLNMLRARACNHPSDWIGGAYNELLGHRKRYRIINRERLIWCLGMTGQPEGAFETWYSATIADLAGKNYLHREPFWSEALAVGSQTWVAGLLPDSRKVRVDSVETSLSVSEAECTYALYVPKRESQSFWRSVD